MCVRMREQSLNHCVKCAYHRSERLQEVYGLLVFSHLDIREFNVGGINLLLK